MEMVIAMVMKMEIVCELWALRRVKSNEMRY